MDYAAIKITTAQAEEILASNYGITGIAKELPGELDFNFRIDVSGSPSYIVKVSRPDADVAYIEYQQALLRHVGTQLETSPRILRDKKGNSLVRIKDEQGEERLVRVLTWVAGRMWSEVNPVSNGLLGSLGTEAARVMMALKGFDHPQAHRAFEWDVAQGLWTQEHLELFSQEDREVIAYFQGGFQSNWEHYNKLPKSVVHNDANDNNVVVEARIPSEKVTAIIDFGDAIYTQVINDVAIAIAYAVMGFENPLQASAPIVKAYHDVYGFSEEELKHLYWAVAMRLVISVTKSAMNKLKEPDNTYLLISEKPAWEVLRKWKAFAPEFAEYFFRATCEYPAHPNADEFRAWAKTQTISIRELFPSLTSDSVFELDLSVESLWLGNYTESDDLSLFDFKLAQLQKEMPQKVLAGGYLEARNLYTSTAFDRIGNEGRESRSIHLGVDFWLPAETPVHTLFDAEVVAVADNNSYKEYGGLVILKHRVDSWEFYTLYGHLSRASLTRIAVGQQLAKGDLIGWLGNSDENGSWSPHLHFQVLLSTLGYVDDFPGVAFYSELPVWSSICPDPNLLFKNPGLAPPVRATNTDLLTYRKNHLGKGLSLQYKVPIKMVRGQGVYLIDQFANKYIDTVNNVAHVGHEHPNVVKAGQQQMAVLNTNSRYLHPNINELAKELLATLPPELNVLHFVNSGSEANELAIRMVKTHTGQRDIIASEVGYHGNANTCIDISSYKFDGKGGAGAPEHTHIIPLPDTFRGVYTGADAAEKYAEEVANQVKKIAAKGRGVGAFIIEPIISCGGQIELPEGFLGQAYQHVRKAGGLCISDEVQTGCGRMGTTYWGFQLHGVTPDIVTIGKPLGNGHPLAAVACTQEVAESFANGMEYFNTFGGNPVSCAIGTAVLKAVRTEGLKDNAAEVGGYLKRALTALSSEFPIIGEVRGQGLFLGIELVNKQKHPLAEEAAYLANRMKEHKILMSTDGPDYNVLKIKPPLVFSQSNADELLYYLRKILREDVMNRYKTA